MFALKSHDVREVRLEALLAETVESARLRENSAFDEMAAPFEQSLILFGAGQFGRRTLAGLRQVGLVEEIVAGETESRTIQMRVLIIFTGVAILLAGLGIYG